MLPLLQDARFALRAIRRDAGFSAVVILTMALGIGTATAIFTLVDGIVLRPLPFPDSERVIAICEVSQDFQDYCVASPPNVRDMLATAGVIAEAGVARTWRYSLTEGSERTTLSAGIATPGFLRVHGVRMELGRLFTDQELEEGSNHVVVLTHDFWMRWSNGDRSVIGTEVVLDNMEFTVVGVLDADAWIPDFDWVDSWTPLTASPENTDQRNWRGFSTVALLDDGVSLEAASSALDATYAALVQEYPDVNGGWGLRVNQLRDQVTGDIQPALQIFSIAVACLLLIGCANVANLLIVRAMARTPEFAVRASLGADQGRLARQLLTECVTLSVPGALAGLVLAAVAVQQGLAYAPEGIPRLDEVGIDARVVVFAFALSAVTALVFGLVPAWRVSRTDVAQILRSARHGDAGTARLRRAILLGQVALAVALLVGAGLAVKGFAGFLRWDPGFDRNGLVTTWISADFGQVTSGEQMVELFSSAAAEIASFPGVESVGQSSAGPLFGGIETDPIIIDGRPSEADAMAMVQWFDIGPRYFETMGTPLVRGRQFQESDNDGSPAVAIVNQALAARYWPDGSPLGAVVTVEEHEARVVGVVADMRPFQPGEATRPAIYWPKRQYRRGATYLIIRTDVDAQVLGRLVKDRLDQEYPALNVSSFSTLDERVARALVGPRFNVFLLAAFALSAVLLATIGIYSVVAYSVGQRTPEIGLRLAVGARPTGIVRAVVSDGARQAVVGAAIGLMGAFALTRSLGAMLYGVSATDWTVFSGVATFFVLVACAASWLPARRAGRVDPVTALRGD